MITHDRYFLDRIPTRIWELEGGQLRQYKGRYSDYLRESTGKPLPEPKAAPEKKPAETTYAKGKEQRRADAQRRKEYAEAEKLVTRLEQEVWSLEQQIASEKERVEREREAARARARAHPSRLSLLPASTSRPGSVPEAVRDEVPSCFPAGTALPPAPWLLLAPRPKRLCLVGLWIRRGPFPRFILFSALHFIS